MRKSVFNHIAVHLAKYSVDSKSFGKVIGIGKGLEATDASRQYSVKHQHFTPLGELLCVGLVSKLNCECCVHDA